jgi:hypothetical protein
MPFTEWAAADEEGVDGQVAYIRMLLQEKQPRALSLSSEEE